MISIAQPALIIGATALSLSLLLFFAYLIKLVSQKTNALRSREINYRTSATSLFEQAAITFTIAGLYAVLMTLFFVLISWVR